MHPVVSFAALILHFLDVFDAARSPSISSDSDLLFAYHLSPDVTETLSLRNRNRNNQEGMDIYVRISILSILFVSVVVLGYLVVYGVSKWIAPSIFADKRKLRYALYASIMTKHRGRNKTCILENGCSGGTMNKCTDPLCCK